MPRVVAFFSFVPTLASFTTFLREGIRSDTLDEVERRYVHPELKARMLREATKPVRKTSAAAHADEDLPGR
jgi:hypothetical protein